MDEQPNSKRNKNPDVDRISALPDEILVSILSGLSLKEAQATSVLSSRWRYLWALSTNLDFYANRDPRIKEEVKLAVARYVRWVDSVLSRHRASTIKRFRIAFEVALETCVHEWIRFALRKGVEVLEMDLSYIMHRYGPRHRLNGRMFGLGEFATFNALCTEYSGFKFLKALDFTRVNLDQEVLEYFICNCSVLERVSVCDTDTLFGLRVVGQSIALKYLTIRKCESLKSIEICEVNLISLTYGGDLARLHLNNLPLLVEVAHVEMGMFSKKIDFSSFSCCVSQLEILKFRYMIPWGKTEPVIPLLPNLECLELDFDEANEYVLLHLACFLRQSPRLHTLVIKFRSMVYNMTRISKSPFAQKRASRCCHDRLKVVKIQEFSGIARQIEVVNYLIKTASNLEKIIFDPNLSGGSCKMLLPRVAMMKKESRAEAHKLKEKLHASNAALNVVCM